MPTPTLTFNPNTTISVGSTFTMLDSAAIVNDGGNTLGAIRITLGLGAGSLGVVVGGALTTTGTIGTVAYLYEPAKRLLSLTSATATGADFTQVLKLVGYGRGAGSIGDIQSICVNLGVPIYSIENGHYYELIAAALTWDNAKIAASARTFFGLTGYLATVTSQIETTFLLDRFNSNGLAGGSSFATVAGTTGANRIWKWETGPETGQTFWNGAAIAGKYAKWAPGEPTNGGQPSSTQNFAPYLLITTYEGYWYEASASNSSPYFVEYSTAAGTGNDGLSGTRSMSEISIVSAAIAALIQSTTAVEVSLFNGVVTNSIGVPLSSVTVGATNATHLQVSIDLGTSNAGKRRQARGFRVISGSERELTATRTQIGEVYNFVFLKTVDGSSSVNLLLN